MLLEELKKNNPIDEGNNVKEEIYFFIEENSSRRYNLNQSN